LALPLLADASSTGRADQALSLGGDLEEADYFFLKTVIPSRKATRDYLDTGAPDEPL